MWGISSRAGYFIFRKDADRGSDGQLKDLDVGNRAHLSGLHFLGSASEGHVRIVGARAVSLLLLDGLDEGAALTRFPFLAPVFEHFPDKLVVLL